jgi:hypothetical protein
MPQNVVQLLQECCAFPVRYSIENLLHLVCIGDVAADWVGRGQLIFV